MNCKVEEHTYDGFRNARHVSIFGRVSCLSTLLSAVRGTWAPVQA